MPYVPYCGRSLWYQEAGEGSTLIFLHGNTASSRLFEPLLPLYTPHFRCVLLDFLGNGRSDRVASFPTDLWQDQARQVLALIREAGYERPCLLGTSGGAWAAVLPPAGADEASGAADGEPGGPHVPAGSGGGIHGHGGADPQCLRVPVPVRRAPGGAHPGGGCGPGGFGIFDGKRMSGECLYSRAIRPGSGPEGTCFVNALTKLYKI